MVTPLGNKIKRAQIEQRPSMSTETGHYLSMGSFSLGNKINRAPRGQRPSMSTEIGHYLC